MARFLLPGSLLNEIAGSQLRYPLFQVLVWNPNKVTINDVAAGVETEAPYDLTAFVETVEYSENIGFENGDDPAVPQASFKFRRLPNTGQEMRRGLVEDGVIVQIRQGDQRVQIQHWIPIFTGTFRGRPGDDPGTPGELSEGISATAYGREERFLNLTMTSETFPADTDLGVMAVAIARDHLGLGQNEILFGAQGVVTKHSTNQLVDLPALQAIWELLFPTGKKPKFDSLGRLVAVDVNLDKPATRIYSGGNHLIKSIVANPNDVEVNNSIVVKGLSHILTKVIQEAQMLSKFEVVTGFFDREYDEKHYFSQDQTARAESTYLVTDKKIKWSDADWSQIDEFHGRVEIDTKYLANVRTTIFVAWLAVKITIAIIDFIYQEDDAIFSILSSLGVPASKPLAALRLALEIASIGTMAALLWSMQFIGRGKYEIWGRPYEFVYQEMVARHQLVGLAPEEVREAEFRNDFISEMAALDVQAQERLRRELVKNQLYTIVLLDDPLLEVDDVIEIENGDRFYILSVEKTLDRKGPPLMKLSCWKVLDGEIARSIDALEAAVA